MATNLGTKITSTLQGHLSENFVDAAAGAFALILATCQGTPPTTANMFEHGCLMNQTDSGTGVPAVYQNTGSFAVPVWTLFDTALAANITRANLSIPAASKILTASPGTIATTSTTTIYGMAPEAGTLTSVDFSGVDVLAASDTNYITWTITNLGQAGAGSNPMLLATAVNTTKVTGGSALAANTKRSLSLNGTPSNLVVAQGDRLQITATVTGTLANTVTFALYQLRFGGTT